MRTLPTVTVGTAGRSLPGLRPLRTVEEELHPRVNYHGIMMTPEEAQLQERYRKAESGADSIGLLRQLTEAGVGAASLVVPGVGIEGAKQTGSEAGKLNPLAKDEENASKQGEAAYEEVKHGGENAVKGVESAVNAATSLPSRVGELLSHEGLANIGKIIAGGLLLIVAIFLFIRVMGGPTPAFI